MNKEKLFKVAEFSKIVKCSIHTLHYYKQIGLFMPIKVDKTNNYSYYSIKQYDEIRSIQHLQKLGLSLNEIKEFLDNKSKESLIKLIDKSKDSLDEKIDELLLTKKNLQLKKDLLLEALSYQDHGVFIGYENDSYLLLSFDKLLHDQDLNSLTINKLYKAVDNNLEYYDFTSVVRSNIKSLEDIDQHAYFALTSIKKNKKLHLKESGNYLAIIHQGSYDSVKKSYSLLFDYSINNNLKLNDTFYEIDLVDSLSAEFEKDYLTKIMVKILD